MEGRGRGEETENGDKINEMTQLWKRQSSHSTARQDILEFQFWCLFFFGVNGLKGCLNIIWSWSSTGDLATTKASCVKTSRAGCSICHCIGLQLHNNKGTKVYVCVSTSMVGLYLIKGDSIKTMKAGILWGEQVTFLPFCALEMIQRES